MELQAAQGIVDAAEAEGVELQVRESYSGRGMYGAETAAIVADDLGDLLVGIARYCGELDPCQDDAKICDVVHFCQSMRQDSMGRGIVVY